MPAAGGGNAGRGRNQRRPRAGPFCTRRPSSLHRRPRGLPHTAGRGPQKSRCAVARLFPHTPHHHKNGAFFVDFGALSCGYWRHRRAFVGRCGWGLRELATVSVGWDARQGALPTLALRGRRGRAASEPQARPRPVPHGFWPHGSPSHSPRSQGPGLTFFCLTGVVSWISPLGCFVGPAQLCLGETFLGKLFLARVSLRGNSSWRNSSWPHFAWPRFARDDTFLL